MAVPLTITVHVAETIRPAVDGRRQLSLGVPSTAGVGDVMESLFKLYPRLWQHVASERRGAQQGLRLVMGSPAVKDQHGGLGTLQQGTRMYLMAASAKKPGTSRG
ncbi:MAG: hypothetical protein M3Y59_10585 [Myxococcota bacterium]|nr:hypothetical protein [Myxococcota bacterium]